MDEALIRAIEKVTAFVHGDGDVEATLHEIAELSIEATGADMAGLTIRGENGRATTAVYTDAMVPEIDQAQYDNDRGPCLDAARTLQTLEVPDTQRDDRWPEFAAAAATHGVRSTLSIPIVVADDGLGALNFYDRTPGFFDDAKRAAARMFAGQCAVTSRYWSAAHKAATLAAALQTRAVIDQAKGVIMARTGRSADEAFEL